MQRILVCDDDGRAVRALRVVLRDAGFPVEAAASANDALDAAALRPLAGVDHDRPPHFAVIYLWACRLRRRRRCRRNASVSNPFIARFISSPLRWIDRST